MADLLHTTVELPITHWQQLRGHELVHITQDACRSIIEHVQIKIVSRISISCLGAGDQPLLVHLRPCLRGLQVCYIWP